MTTAIGIAEDLQKGLIERFRALPMARSAVLGRQDDFGPRPEHRRRTSFSRRSVSRSDSASARTSPEYIAGVLI